VRARISQYALIGRFYFQNAGRNFHDKDEEGTGEEKCRVGVLIFLFLMVKEACALHNGGSI
jgi:hypothetical protein